MSALQRSREAANGLYAEFNLNNSLMWEAASCCPLILSGGRKGTNRCIRYIVQNDTTRFTSKTLLNKIHGEVADHLKEHYGITVKTSRSHEEWVLAPTNGRGSSGQRHRDTRCQQPGILTVLLFFGDRKRREGSGSYGGVKVWRNSQDLYRGRDGIGEGEFKNSRRRLMDCDGETGKIANLQEFNCVVFDSRLIHESLQHTQHTPRASLTFYLRFPGMPPINDANDEDYLNPEECGIINMQEYL